MSQGWIKKKKKKVLLGKGHGNKSDLDRQGRVSYKMWASVSKSQKQQQGYFTELLWRLKWYRRNAMYTEDTYYFYYFQFP